MSPRRTLLFIKDAFCVTSPYTPLYKRRILCYLAVHSFAGPQTQLAYSTDVGRYPVHWAGFQDPHSGLAYFRVGLGSSAGQVDIHPFRYVGLKTCECCWNILFLSSSSAFLLCMCVVVLCCLFVSVCVCVCVCVFGVGVMCVLRVLLSFSAANPFLLCV